MITPVDESITTISSRKPTETLLTSDSPRIIDNATSLSQYGVFIALHRTPPYINKGSCFYTIATLCLYKNNLPSVSVYALEITEETTNTVLNKTTYATRTIQFNAPFDLYERLKETNTCYKILDEQFYLFVQNILKRDCAVCNDADMMAWSRLSFSIKSKLHPSTKEETKPPEITNVSTSPVQDVIIYPGTVPKKEETPSNSFIVNPKLFSGKDVDNIFAEIIGEHITRALTITKEEIDYLNDVYDLTPPSGEEIDGEEEIIVDAETTEETQDTIKSLPQVTLKADGSITVGGNSAAQSPTNPLGLTNNYYDDEFSADRFCCE